MQIVFVIFEIRKKSEIISQTVLEAKKNITKKY